MATSQEDKSPAASPDNNKHGLKIINAALFRMGTKSMAKAYKILGFETHHGLLEDVMDSPWTQIEQAAEATWPASATPDEGRPSERRPFSRADWDALWGDRYDAVTDLASPFAPQLIRAYGPDVKVVVVQRDFDTWWPSFRKEVLDRVMAQPQTTIAAFVCWNVLGIRCVHAMRKVHFGFLGARSREEAQSEESGRRAYEQYFRKVRALTVPAAEVSEEEARRLGRPRRLEYRMGDGWEPLCEFLGVPVPEGDVPFPRENEAASHEMEVRSRVAKFRDGAARKAMPWVAVLLTAAGAAYLAWWMR